MLPRASRRMERVHSRTFDRMRSDPGFRRSALLGGTGAAVAVIMLAAVIVIVVALTSSAGLADRLAEAGVALGGATLLLAAVAAVVALLAYAASTGLPDIQLSVHFPFSTANNPQFEADTEEGGRLKAKDFKQIRATILLRNNSGYSARNPAVAIRLDAMASWPVSSGQPRIARSPPFPESCPRAGPHSTSPARTGLRQSSGTEGQLTPSTGTPPGSCLTLSLITCVPSQTGEHPL